MDFWKILEYTSSVAIVGMLIWLVKLVLHDKLDARWHYFIWLVLLVRMAIPVDFSLIRTPVSVFQGIPLGRWIEFGRLWAGKNGYGEIVIMLGRIYVWGAALLGGYYLATWAALRISLRSAPKADAETRRYVDDIAAKYGLKSCDDIRIGKCGSPYICGLIRPALVLPEDNTRPQEPVILHELLHRKWKDVAVNIGLHIARALNWFHPAVWFLTDVVQNDGEALCDERVLECCGGGMEKEYGEMLLAAARHKRRNPVKVGTSDMAGSYRNMKTRIRRICDFHRVPEGIGLAAFCITLMLAVSGIGVSAQEQGFEAAAFETEAELQRELWKAQLYHARTPEEAVWLFLRAAAERNVFYRMAVLPGEHTEAFEAWAEACLRQGHLNGEGVFDAMGDLQAVGGQESGEANGHMAGVFGEMAAYFPGESREIADWQSHRVYNLQYGEGQGTATVFVRLRNGEDGAGYTEWKLNLTEEDGWKVWLAGDTGRMAGEYQEPCLLYGRAQLGDFVLEAFSYNEAYFDFQKVTAEPAPSPDGFSQEYQVTEYTIAYRGQEPLDGRSVRVEVVADGEGAPIEERLSMEEEISMEEGLSMEEMAALHRMMAGDALSPGDSGERASGEDGSLETPDHSYCLIGNGYVITGFDGSALTGGLPHALGGGSVDSDGFGGRWKPDDRICAHVRIYVDDRLVEEGEIWSGNL
ncbi:MAG: M56 family metallopeptidase [Eubacterium sp.]|nr:M56 family metallopeptidase [Eubacterium sp.]MCM1304315.1 M56 family metallopeptidase [Butyrivibrio sp.]MCM1344062.1 M56 family metallopeptidase [Muribaculaceae bacterium]MCM1409250.1 M56 family metallopeptidase [Lachnospiraceae bacterium]